MERDDVIRLYDELLNRSPENEDVIQEAISSGATLDQLREAIMQSPEYASPQTFQTASQLNQIGSRGNIRVNTSADRLTPADYAYALTTGTDLNLPDYQIAELAPDVRYAMELARQQEGLYQPFLAQGAESTMQGIGALGNALSGTRNLASQIPRQVSSGQGALGQAASDTMRFTEQGVADARRAAEASYLVGEQARGIAADVTGRARALFDPLESDLSRSTTSTLGQAVTGQLGADIAAQRARMSTADAQGALQAASQFGLGSAEQGIAGLRGSSAMYSPDMIAPFMNTYEDAAVQQALADIARQGQMQEEEIAAQAVQSGAYGGSRQAVAEQELARNVMQQQGRTAAEMRSSGFESAAARSQDAFERALARQQQEAQLTGQLGQMGAGSAASAAEAGGRLGLAAEQLAQGSALQGAQLGLSAEQMASANALALAQTGLNIEQLASQTGMTAQQIAGQMAGQAGQLGIQAGQLGIQGAGQAGSLGLQSANLGLSGIQAGLGAQQQAAGIGQGIGSLGQQAANMGQQAQQMGVQDLSTKLQMGQLQTAQDQSQLDAQRMNEYQRAMLPYQQVAFQQEIMSGTPMGSSMVMSQPMQSPSLISQLGGAALGIAGLARAFG